VKRNVRRRGRDQKTHLKIARSTCDILYPDGSWRNKNGAPTKRDEIVNFAREHPGYSNRQIAETLGVSRNTVNKWMRKTED
jgi:DNA-binding NarL/FixJ family response regulator